MIVWLLVWAFARRRSRPRRGRHRKRSDRRPRQQKDVPVPSPAPISSDIPAPSTDRLYVARGPKAADRHDVFATLAAAVAKAKPGQLILVLVPEIDEQVSVDGRLNGVRIETGGHPVMWRPPADAPADVPLLRMDSPGSARVKGFMFNGGNRVNTLIHITGACTACAPGRPIPDGRPEAIACPGRYRRCAGAGRDP